MKLNDNTFILYAGRHYDNPNCENYDEFIGDLNRIKYIKKLFSIYRKTGELKERLVLNHLIILYNVFTPPQALTKMLFFKLDEYWDCLVPFLFHLNYLPILIEDGTRNRCVETEKIVGDAEIERRIDGIMRG